MDNNLQLEFTIDKEDKTITVRRSFAAALQNVWSAWTERDKLDQWWAPKPYQAHTREMLFKEGGYWLYAMVGPDGTEQWCRADYIAIATLKSFSWRDAFCDESGTIVQDFPRSIWTNTFSTGGKDTLVTNLIQYTELADLEKILEMGFKEGYTAGLNNLEAFLKE